MSMRKFKVGDLVKWRPEALKGRYGIVVEVTKSSVFVAWIISGSRNGFNKYDIDEALELVNE